MTRLSIGVSTHPKQDAAAQMERSEVAENDIECHCCGTKA